MEVLENMLRFSKERTSLKKKHYLGKDLKHLRPSRLLKNRVMLDFVWDGWLEIACMIVVHMTYRFAAKSINLLVLAYKQAQSLCIAA